MKEMNMLLGEDDDEEESKDSEDVQSNISDFTTRASLFMADPYTIIGKTVYVLIMICFFIGEVLKTIIFPFLHRTLPEPYQLPQDPLRMYQPKMDEAVFQFAGSRNPARRISKTGKKRKVRETYIFCLDETAPFPTYVKVIILAPRLNPSLLLPEKYLPHSFATGSNYFSRTKNIFMKNFGIFSNPHMGLYQNLNIHQVHSSDTDIQSVSSQRLPVLPSPMFLAQVLGEAKKSAAILQRCSKSCDEALQAHRESMEAEYFSKRDTVSMLHPLYQDQNVARRTVSRTSLLIKHKDSAVRLHKKRSKHALKSVFSSASSRLTNFFTAQTDFIHSEQIRELVMENFALETYQLRLAYLDSVVTYLKNESRSISVIGNPLAVKIIIAIYFIFILLLLCCIEGDHYVGLNKKFITTEITIIRVILMLFEVLLIYTYIEQFHRVKLDNVTSYFKKQWNAMHLQCKEAAIVKFYSSKVRILPGGYFVGAITILPLLFNIARTQNPIPPMFAGLMIFIASRYSISPKHIPWNTVIGCYALQYYLTIAFFYFPSANHYYNNLSKLNLQFFGATCGKLATSFQDFFRFFPYLIYWINMLIFSNFLLEIVRHFNVFGLFLRFIGLLSYICAATKLELAYLYSGVFFSHHQVIRLNSNMPRLLTKSELFLVFVTLLTLSNYATVVTYQILGVPFGHCLRFTIISLPGILATSKIFYPEVQTSKTAERGLISRHPSAVQFTQLLTDIWISSAAAALKHVVKMSAMIIGATSVSQSLSVIIREIVPLDIPINSMKMVANLFVPIMLLIGIIDIAEAHAAAYIVSLRFFIANDYAIFIYSSYLHQRWMLDCLLENRDNLSILTIPTAYEYKLRVLVDGNAVILPAPQLSHRTIFILLPLILTTLGVCTHILITASVVSVLPQRSMKWTADMSIRAAAASLMSNLITAIFAGLVFWTDIQLECITSRKDISLASTDFCGKFIDKVKLSFAENSSMQYICFDMSM